jgi:hypothetical protein
MPQSLPAKRRAVLVPIALLVILAAAPGAETPGAEVAALERELVAAIAKGDLATYDRIVADDYVAF